MGQRYKLIQKIITILFLFFILFFFTNLFYNHNKGILASEEEEEEKGRLLCGKEIPVGEAMEKTGELLEKIVGELEKIDINSYYLIKTQREMEELAEKCDVKKYCTPECKTVTIRDVIVDCIADKCQGDPCPGKKEIDKLFNEIIAYNNQIQEAKDKIHKLIYEETESLCTKENGDISTKWEKSQCISITIQEAIRRKLNLSRGEFNKCYVPAAELEKVRKLLLNCDTVMSQNLPRETKTEEKGIPVCTSLHNWFCCH